VTIYYVTGVKIFSNTNLTVMTRTVQHDFPRVRSPIMEVSLEDSV